VGLLPNTNGTANAVKIAHNVDLQRQQKHAKNTNLKGNTLTGAHQKNANTPHESQ